MLGAHPLDSQPRRVLKNADAKSQHADRQDGRRPRDRTNAHMAMHVREAIQWEKADTESSVTPPALKSSRPSLRPEAQPSGACSPPTKLRSKLLCAL